MTRGRIARRGWSMSRRLRVAGERGIGVLALLGLVAQAPQPQPPPELRRDVFRVETEVVLLDLVVRDKKGRTVRDLRPDELTVFEDGVKQDVGSFRFLDSRALGEALEQATQAPEPAKATPEQATSAPGGAPRAAQPAESRHLNLVTLLFDRLAPDGRNIARKAALSFLELEDRPDVYVSVFQIDESLKLLQQFTTDRETTRHAIERATGELDTQYTAATEQLVEASRQASEAQQRVDAFLQAEGGTSNPAVGAQLGQQLAMSNMTVNALRLTETLQREQQGRSSLFAILALARQQQALAGRKTILFFSEGVQAPATLEHVLKAAISEANRANVSVYAVDARGLSTHSTLDAARDTLQEAVSTSMHQQMSRGTLPVTREEATIADNAEAAIRMDPIGNLQDLAGGTGGMLIGNTNDVRAGIAHAVGDLRGYYEVAYSPSNHEFDGKFRSISVKVSRPGVVVQTRSGYFAMPPGEATVTFPYELKLLKAMREAEPPHEFPIRSRVFRFGPEPGGTRYTVVLEIPLDAISVTRDKDPSLDRAHFAFMGVVRSSWGSVEEKFGQDMPLWLPRKQAEAVRRGNAVFMRSFTLPVGRHSLETAAVDEQSGRRTVEQARLSVPPQLPQPVGLSNLAVVKRIESLPKGALVSEDPFRVGSKRVVPWVAEPELDGSEEIRLFFVAWAPVDAEPRPQIAVEFVQDGQVVGRLEPPLPRADAQGRIPCVVSLPPARFGPGQYEARAELRQGTYRAWERCQFRVVGPAS
ncbi:MAG TPA: VWA domain-containing protein [Vicinamibacteria bacterium]|nr:VWA domain-containing protein [Vicinamibacteria bacterium]